MQYYAPLSDGEGAFYRINPRNAHLKIFNTISAYLCSCRCKYCYHIKQTYCIFFSPKTFCDAHKVLKRRLRPGLRPDPAGGAHDVPSDPAGEGTPLPNLNPTSMPSAPHFSESPPNFFLNTALERLTGVGNLTWIQLQRVGKEEASPKTRNSIQITTTCPILDL